MYRLAQNKGAFLGDRGTVGFGFWKIYWGTRIPCANLCPNVVQLKHIDLARLKLHVFEMEALTAVQVALLTIYDMCKAVDRGMVMGDVKLLEKSGGKSGTWTAEK